jgi:hypothetical protein
MAKKRTKAERNQLIKEIHWLHDKSGIRNPFQLANSLGTSASFVARVLRGEVNYEKQSLIS